MTDRTCLDLAAEGDRLHATAPRLTDSEIVNWWFDNWPAIAAALRDWPVMFNAVVADNDALRVRAETAEAAEADTIDAVRIILSELHDEDCESLGMLYVFSMYDISRLADRIAKSLAQREASRD